MTQPKKEPWWNKWQFAFTVILALALQFAGLVAWGTRQDLTDVRQERDIEALQQNLQTVTDQQGTTNSRLASLEKGQEFQTDILKDIREDLNALRNDRLNDRRKP